jgi:hypothetical protein
MDASISVRLDPIDFDTGAARCDPPQRKCLSAEPSLAGRDESPKGGWTVAGVHADAAHDRRGVGGSEESC